ncbi:hypothetical protein TrVE_jg140 [Triparma verrucosa]|uniref:Uncharacterized protein n=1 Tax=Triparma verrucosa TaxID=1606542 RepID=A0A9W7F6R5_9STRA|nr:hypothetical protein TrVE_jg140 [Triparma verrucosa]
MEYDDFKLNEYEYGMIERPSDWWDLVAASGLLSCYVAGNFRRVRKRYGTFGAAMRLIPGRERKPYHPEEEMEVKVKIIGFFLGAFLGYGVAARIWGVPDYLGALAGGGVWVSAASTESKVGDLARLTGRKVLEVVSIVGRLEKEVFLVRKSARVTKNIVAAVTLMDGRFKIMERTGRLVGKITGRGGEDENDEEGEEGGSGRGRGRGGNKEGMERGRGPPRRGPPPGRREGGGEGGGDGRRRRGGPPPPPGRERPRGRGPPPQGEGGGGRGSQSRRRPPPPPPPM